MSDADWKRVFDEAEDLGISFILLTGGEPKKQDILFPIFTNGTFIDSRYLDYLIKTAIFFPS